MSCNGGDSGTESHDDSNSTSEIYDVDTHGIPQFVNEDYIELDKIVQISKFRSGVGHDYSDNFESCRSMKHYFQPDNDIDWSTVKIFSPVHGIIDKIEQEWAGTQVQIKSEENLAFIFILFHVDLKDTLHIGDVFSTGQQLGTHIGSQTMSDIAVRVNTPNGWKLISYFEVIKDSVFQYYQTRGLTSRNDMIISKEERDNDLLACIHEEFENEGNLENWVKLN